MMSSRKFFMLPALLVLAMVGGGVAQAQYGLCTIAATPTTVRAEGVTEEAGGISLQCGSLTTAIAADTEIGVTVALENSIAITNKIRVASGTTYAVGTAIAVTIAGAAAEDDAVTGDTDGTDLGQGKLVGSTLQWTLKIPEALGTSGNALVINISGLRVNASASAGTVRATTEFGGVPILNTGTHTIARTTAGLVAGMKKGSKAVTGVQCVAGKASEGGVTLEIKEGFAAAFQTSGSDSVGGVAETPAMSGLGDIFVMVSLSDIPDGVVVKAANSVHCANPRYTALTAEEKVTNDALTPGTDEEFIPMDAAILKWVSDIEGDGIVDFAGTLVEDADGNPTATPTIAVNLTGGSGYILYNVAMDTREDVATCDVALEVSWAHNPAKDQTVALGTGNVSVSFGPMSSASAAHATAPIPRFANTGSAIKLVMTESCSTTLLFPFVTNMAGFDTGIAIANTSQDTFGTSPQGGTCEINLHNGTMTAATDDAEAMTSAMTHTSGSVAAGEQLILTVSGMMAGFQGYATAVCEFQFAHGLAFVTNGFGVGAPNLAHGYLALVVGNRTAAADESLGQ